jgi:beta-ketoacyl-acyl-carrier-protein synthase II
MSERIVITGVGAVSPLGLSAEESWKNALGGVSGVGPLTVFDASEFLVHIAAEVKNFKPELFLPVKEVKRQDRYQQFAMIAAKEAIEQANLADLSNRNVDPIRVGVVVSSAIGGLSTLHDNIATVLNDGPRRLGPFIIPMLMPNGASGMIGIQYNFQGPSMSVSSACASGSDGIGLAWMMLKSGVVDVVVAGGSEATITPVAVGAFDRLGAMSRRNEPISDGKYMTPSPFDSNRDGLVMGEGAGVLIMERESHAKARGATILAEFAAYASTADAFHITAPSDNGSGSSRAMEYALKEANVGIEAVDYINAHGTATVLNDLSETKAIKNVFGKRAYNIPISSTKSMTGHMMGATGALEAVFCVLAIRDGWVPPTINYLTPDPECDLDYVPNQARQQQVNLAISNAFGFGGHNSVLVIRKI